MFCPFLSQFVVRGLNVFGAFVLGGVLYLLEEFCCDAVEWRGAGGAEQGGFVGVDVSAAAAWNSEWCAAMAAGEQPLSVEGERGYVVAVAAFDGFGHVVFRG